MPSDKRNLARHLRNHMSKPEVLLWMRLRQDRLGCKIRRQFQFDNYIFDFYCSNPKVDIEIDGRIHERMEEYDHRRDDSVEAKGVRVLRLSAQAVLQNPDGVAIRVKEFLDSLQSNTSQSASPDGEAGEERTG